MPFALICWGVADATPTRVRRWAIAKLYMLTSVPETWIWYELFVGAVTTGFSIGGSYGIGGGGG